MAGGADHLLLDLVRRRLRRGSAGWLVLALHLSRLPPPLPLPHHRRVARALMEGAALRHDGQLFLLGCGDLVLVCLESGPSTRVATDTTPPALLPDILRRLLRVDVPDVGDPLVSLWRLPAEGAAVTAYATQAAAAPLASAAPGPSPAVRASAALPASAGPLPGWSSSAWSSSAWSSLSSPAALPSSAAASQIEVGAADTGVALAAMAALDRLDAPEDLLQRQTGVLIAHRPRDDIRPLFRRLAAAPLVPDGELDPTLRAHLAGRLGERLLQRLAALIDCPESLGVAAGGPPIHLALRLASAETPALADLAAAASARGVSLAAELDVADVMADPAAFRAARRVFARWGWPVVLDGVTSLSLRLLRVAALAPDLLRLEWSPRLAAGDREDIASVAALLAGITLDRVVLVRADSEPALLWGLEHGVRRFAGRHVEAMLAASRLSSCAQAVGCGLRACLTRAGGVTASARAGCGNPALLAAGKGPVT